MYDKRYVTSKEIRVERSRLKAFQSFIQQKQLRADMHAHKMNGPLVRPLAERINKFKERIMKNPDKYKMMFNDDATVLKKDTELQRNLSVF